MSTEHELRDEFGTALAMPDGPAKIHALDTVIRHADASANEALAFEFRHEAIETYVFAGEDRRAFLAFSQSLAAYDRDPAIGGGGTDHSILWQFKWIVNALPDYPDVPLDRTYAVLDDMQRRYLQGGHSLHAVHQAKWQIAMHVGDVEQADQSYHDMVVAKRDGLSNCAVCVPSAQVWYLSDRGRYEEAITVGRPVQQGTCREQPQWVLANLMLPYSHCGRTADAADAHRQSYRRMRTRHTYLAGIGVHLAFLGRTGNEARGLEVLERHLPWLDIAPSPGEALRFSAPAVQVLRRVQAAGHGELTLMGRPDAKGQRAQTTVDALESELVAVVEGLTARFDARNGNTHQSEQARRTMAADLVLDRLSLSVDLPGQRTTRVRQLQESVATHTEAGDAPAAALARLELAIALAQPGPSEERSGQATQARTEERLAAAEEAAAALERLGLTDALRTARLLLWDLYRGAYRYRDEAEAQLELVLADEGLAPPQRAKVLVEAAMLTWGAERTERYARAAEIYRGLGDAPAELEALVGAIDSAPQDDDDQLDDGDRGAEWIARGDELCATGESPTSAVYVFHFAVARLLNGEDRTEEALARADLATQFVPAEAGADVRSAAPTMAIYLLLKLERPVEAEQRVRVLLEDQEQNRRRLSVLLAAALRAQGRTDEVDSIVSQYKIEQWELTEDDEYDDEYDEDEDDDEDGDDEDEDEDDKAT